MNEPFIAAPPTSDAIAAAVNLLYEHIHALPHDEYGVINMLPFSQDSDATRIIKRHFCEAVVGLLNGSGYIRHDTPKPVVSQTAVVKCSACGEPIVQIVTDGEGVSNVDSRLFIAGLAALNPQCPHKPLSLDDMRAHMEQQFWASTCRECGVSDVELTDGLCDGCKDGRQ